MSPPSNQFAVLEQVALMKEKWEKLVMNEAGSDASGDRAQADSRSAGETSSTERDTSGPSARHGSEGTDPKAKKEQDGAARSTEEEGRYKLKNPIVWMDLEMTGLDPDTDHILEVAVLITDSELSGPHLEGPDLVVHQPTEVLDNMNEWCIKHHGKSGLTQKSRSSTISLQEAEDQVLAFLQQHTQSMEQPGATEYKAHLAGNSIYVDRAFLRKHMPRVHAHLHWRLIDVSTLLELARRWFPTEFKHAPKKRVLHTAMADIRESLNELKFYRRTIFKQPGVNFREYLAATKQQGPQSQQRKTK